MPAVCAAMPLPGRSPASAALDASDREHENHFRHFNTTQVKDCDACPK